MCIRDSVQVDNPTEHTAGGQWIEIGSDGQTKSSTQPDGFGDDWSGSGSTPVDSGGASDGGGDGGGADGDGGGEGGSDGGGGGGGGGGDGGGGGGGGGGDDDLGPINEDSVNPTSRLDTAKLDKAHAATGNGLTTTANASSLSTPAGLQASSLRGASQLIQSMASFGAPSGALNQEHGLAGAIHPAEMGLAAGRHPGRMVA